MASMAKSFEQRKRQQFLTRVAAVLRTSPHEVERLLSNDLLPSVRVNTLTEIPPDVILQQMREQEFGVEPIPWCPNGYFLKGKKAELARSDFFQRGYVYIQNASSLVPVLALDPQPGDGILDVCAAPGGKAAHMAAVVLNDCNLWVNDAIAPRLEKLREVTSTFRVRVGQMTGFPGQYIDKYIDRQFDRILLDAQCGGESRIDFRHPQALRFWSPERVEKNSRLQKKMIVAAFKLLRPGGIMVYSTCTLAPEENEEPVDYLLRHHPAAVEEVRLPLDARSGLTVWEGKRLHSDLEKAVRIVPSAYMEAFFICKIRKVDESY